MRGREKVPLQRGGCEVGSSPMSGSGLSMESTWESLSLPPAPPSLCALSLLKKNNKNKERPNRLCFLLERRIEA